MKIDAARVNILDRLKTIPRIICLQNLRYKSNAWLFEHCICFATVLWLMLRQAFGLCSIWIKIPAGLTQDYLRLSANLNIEITNKTTQNTSIPQWAVCSIGRHWIEQQFYKWLKGDSILPPKAHSTGKMKFISLVWLRDILCKNLD